MYCTNNIKRQEFFSQTRVVLLLVFVTIFSNFRDRHVSNLLYGTKIAVLKLKKEEGNFHYTELTAPRGRVIKLL